MSDTTSQRLQAIQTELAKILEARLNELSDAMKQTEATTRRILAAEIEIERHAASREQFERDLLGVEAEAKAARAQAEEGRTQHGNLLRERDRLRAEVQRIEREVRDADAEIEQNRKRSRELESTSETLRRENTALKVKLKTLEENVVRMRQIQKELMTSMSELTQKMTDLSAGDKE
jgi:chromosome segregation ATPase